MSDTSDSVTVDGSAPGSPDRAAIVIPGLAYPVEAPLLYFTTDVVDNRDAYVERIRWTPPDHDQAALRAWLSGYEGEVWVCGQVADAVARVEKAVPGARTVLIGKSLGTRAAPVAADSGLPAIWYTPLLRSPSTVAALRRASAPFLLVGGTADEAWDGELARELTPHVVELPDADHSLLVPGAVSASLAAHTAALAAAEDFLDTVAWA